MRVKAEPCTCGTRGLHRGCSCWHHDGNEVLRLGPRVFVGFDPGATAETAGLHTVFIDDAGRLHVQRL